MRRGRNLFEGRLDGARQTAKLLQLDAIAIQLELLR